MNRKQETIDIQEYMTKGVERVVSEAIKAEDAGEHIPPFLIASITSKCNLHCAGCYSRCNHATVDAAPVAQLTGEEWLRIFEEADDLGISFILLAGGEPMLRRDVIEAAGQKSNILFPIFTNGTFMDELHRRGLIFGASVTVTTENIREVSSPDFLKSLSDRGCKDLWRLRGCGKRLLPH